MAVPPLRQGTTLCSANAEGRRHGGHPEGRPWESPRLRWLPCNPLRRLRGASSGQVSDEATEGVSAERWRADDGGEAGDDNGASGPGDRGRSSPVGVAEKHGGGLKAASVFEGECHPSNRFGLGGWPWGGSGEDPWSLVGLGVSRHTSPLRGLSQFRSHVADSANPGFLGAQLVADPDGFPCMCSSHPRVSALRLTSPRTDLNRVASRYLRRERLLVSARACSSFLRMVYPRSRPQVALSPENTHRCPISGSPRSDPLVAIGQMASAAR